MPAERAAVSRVRMTFHACGTKLVVVARAASEPTKVAASKVGPPGGGARQPIGRCQVPRPPPEVMPGECSPGAPVPGKPHLAGVTTVPAATTCQAMSQPPDLPPAKPKLSAEERRTRQAERLKCIRLRMAIGQALDERGITDPRAIGKALGMLTLEATQMLTRHRWREGDVELLQAAAARLGLTVRDW
jgi:hypothetical protein